MDSAEEKEWVEVANDLLSRCNIDLHITSLFDCGAKVFISLYESILGEKVPDLIALPRCQEDDAHNLQAIIDSLALDYLQVSLSHITGENIVKGDRESIRNLLEIFDGLLEYLTEEIIETTSQDGTEWKNTASGDLGQTAEDKAHSIGLEEAEGGSDMPFSSLKKLPSVMGSSQSSDIFIPSGEVDGSESTSELIKLGDTAYLFSLRNEEFPFPKELPASKGISVKANEPEEPAVFAERSSSLSSSRRAPVTETEGSAKSAELPSEQLSSSAKKLGEPIRSAIALQPPYQPSVPRAPYPDERGTRNAARCAPPLIKPRELPSSDLAEPLGQESETLSGGIPSLSRITSDLPAEVDETGPKSGSKVTIKEPDVIDELVSEESMDDMGKDTDEKIQDKSTTSSKKFPKFTSTQRTRTKQKVNWKSQHESSDSVAEEPFSHKREKEKLSNQELHQMSEKLSRRLNELDAMLKNALGDRSRRGSSADGDTLSQHSDSVMDYHHTKAEPATQLPKRKPSRRSFSASPPPSTRQLSSELEDALWRDGRGATGEMCDRLQKEQDQRRLRAKLLMKAYEDELRAYEASERLELAKIKAKTKEMDRRYKESLFKEPPRVSRPAEVYSRKTVPRNLKRSQWISRGGFAKPKKAAPMKVKENDLLPLLMEEFPHLHISRPTMNKMWQQQLAQIQQLKSPSNRTQLKLQNEVVEAQKKHELLVELIKKEQAHNKRLQDFKECIQRQKCAQNNMRARRQQIVRAKKYYQDYRVQLRAKMMRARTREELIFKKLFEEGLDIQKQRLHELRTYARDKRAEQMRQHQAELESMENYYKDQFSMLAEAVSEERREIHARERTQARTLSKVKREFRSKIEKEIQELQDAIIQNDDNSFFRELEADRLRSRLQMASFQYSKNYHLF
ncbi:centrosomal protein of 95 kDa [Eublepharis macularius]|uniref:Centrosomal protein of 95 kDa n=1 Tax=Eublepharis macularius TaxID=481883 RepID=A0AA97KW39_EUBMA|nr:centrosomal protein of 95 kDa [Eublepharis macularius]